MSVFAVSLNILFASREIKLPFLLFVKPMITQMFISVIAVWIVIWITNEIKTYDIILILIKSIIFAVLYFLINKSLKTSSYCYVMEQIMPVIKRKFG